MKDEEKGGNVTERIEHKPARVVLKRDAGEIPPEVEREDELVHWASALYENAMRIAAAGGVLAREGSLEKAASVLWWADFAVPAGYFPDGHEGEYLDGHDEEALRLWVEGEAGRIGGVIGTGGFRLAATGRFLDEALDEEAGIEAGEVILKTEALRVLGIAPEDLTGLDGASMGVPDPETGEAVPVPLRKMGGDDHRRVLDALERERERCATMKKLCGDLAARMREHGCGPVVTVREFLEGGG